MCYGDLIILELCDKLSMVSFSEPRKNLEVYKFIHSLFPFQDFFAKERNKIIDKHTENDDEGHLVILGEENVAEYNKEINNLLGMKIDVDIYIPDLTIDDFSDENCQYPKDKNLWMSAKDIDSIFNFLDKLRGEANQ